MTLTADPRDLAAVRAENLKLRRINKVLMDRVERAMDFQGGAFSLFQAAIVLEHKVQERTLELENALQALDKSHRDLVHANALAETMRARLEEAIESINEGFALFDAEDRLILCNRKYLSFWPDIADSIRPGMSFHEIAALVATARQAGVPGQAPDVWLSQRLGQHAELDGPHVHRLADGRWIQINERRTRDGGVVGVYSDITDLMAFEERRHARELVRKVEERTAELTRLNQQLQTEIRERAAAVTAARIAKAEAEQANLSKTKFIAAASHDLLQPLNAARLFVAALGDLETSTPVGAMVANVDTALTAVEDLLSALLDISKLDAGAVRPEIADFPAHALLGALATEYAALARERGLRLIVVPCRAVIRSDIRLLRRVVQNFLSNALRYTARGRVLIGCRRGRDGLRIEVWDSGPGIPDEKLGEIFQEFRRLDAPQHDDRQRGIGLGLAIVDRVAGMLGHEITVRSWVGWGSCFAVQVPVGNHPAPLAGDGAAGRVLGSALAGRRVLVLDNEPSVVAGMTALLSGWGCRVRGATTRLQARAALATDPTPPELLIADYHLDDGALGLDVIAELRAALPVPVPAILITADHSTELPEAAENAACMLLNKPVRPAQLRALMTGLLAG